VSIKPVAIQWEASPDRAGSSHYGFSLARSGH